MPNYEQGTLGKLIVQDWDVVSAWSDTPLLFILTRQQAAALVALCPPLKWKTRWSNAPAADVRDAFVAEMMFNLMNPITCGMLAECLQPLFDAQNVTIQNFITYGTGTPGLPLTELELTENIAGTTNPDCNRDIVWAQCLALVQYTDLAITTLFEQIESATNSAELLELLDSVPFLNFITTQIGVSGAGAVANYFQEAVTEGYLAQYTPEVEETLACGLFCLFRDDCVITLDSVVDYFNSRAIALVPDEPSDLLELIEIVAGLDFDGTEVVDIMFWFAWQGMKLAQFVISGASDISQFQKLLLLAVDDASSDWELLCVECPVDWCHTVFLSEELPAIVTIAEGNQVAGGVEAVAGFDAGNSKWLVRAAINVTFAGATDIVSINGIYDLEKGNFDAPSAFVINAVQLFNGVPVLQVEASVQSDLDIDGDDKSLLINSEATGEIIVFIVHASRQSGTPGGGSALLKSIEICGTGTEPDWSPA